jgi:hypothetical protein
MITSTQKYLYRRTRGLNHGETQQLLKKDAVNAYTNLKGKADLNFRKRT